jgi:hypothetical protein
LPLHPKRVIFAHGKWFSENATERLRHSLSWLTEFTPAVPLRTVAK